VAVPGAATPVREVVEILPAPRGFDHASSTVTPLDAAGVQETLAGRALPEVAAEFEELGLDEAVLRTWTGPDGRRAEVVVSRWDDHFTATNVGAGPSQLLLGTEGARAWTPRDLPGARGVRVTGAGGPDVRVLSVAVDDVSLFVRMTGPTGDEPVERTLDLLTTRLRATPSAS
jgi:hypothetical protein